MNSNANHASQKKVKLGVVVSPHGVRGHVKIKTFTEEPENLCAYGALEDAKGKLVEVRISGKTAKGLLIAFVKGIADRNAAELFTGTELFVDRDALPEADEGEFYHEDLVGLVVKDTEQNVLGKVAGAHNYGAGDILEIAFDEKPQTELFLFDDTTVPEVHMDKGYVVVNLPEAVIAKEK
jgi:16S rRNA processing protein RimM